MLSIKNYSKKLFVLLLMSLTVWGCSDFNHEGGFGPTYTEEVDVAGFILRQNGSDILEINNGNVILESEIQVKIGNGTSVYSVEFYDENENAIEYLGNDLHLSCTTDDVNYISIKHYDFPQGELHIQGKQTGEAWFRISLMNGDPATPEYQSPEISIKVSEK